MKTGCNPGSGAIGKVKIRTTITLETTMFACECGARLAEKSGIMLEPLAEIGNRPVLRHIMEIYFFPGIDGFIFRPGYKDHL